MTSAITEETAAKLAALYEQRRDIRRLYNDADRNFWVGIRDAMFGGTGSRSAVADALGGNDGFVPWLHSVADARFEALLVEIDQDIEAAGGQP